MGFTVKVSGVEIRCDTAEEAAALARVRAETSDPGRRSFGSVRTEETPKGVRISAVWWEGGKRRRRRGFKERAAAEAFLNGLKVARAPCLRCQGTDHTTEVCPRPRTAASPRSENAQTWPSYAPPAPVYAPAIEVEKQQVNGGNSSQVAEVPPEFPGARGCSLCHKPGHYARTCPERAAPPSPRPKRIPLSFDDPGTGKKRRALCRHCLKYGHIARSCPNPAAEPPTVSADMPKRPVPQIDTPEGGVGRGRRGAQRVCAKCGGVGHSKKSCREGLDAPEGVKLPPREAKPGERYRVIEDCEDETGARWRGDELWEVVSPCGPLTKHPVQWRLRRERDGAEEVGWPTLYPFQLVVKGGPALDSNWRLGLGGLADAQAA